MTTDAHVDVVDNITYNRDWYTGTLSTTVEWEGRNWKTKTYTENSAVYYITDGVSQNVIRTTVDYFEPLKPNEYIMRVQVSDKSFSLPGGATVKGYVLRWAKDIPDNTHRRLVHTEEMASIVVDSTEKVTYETNIRKQWLYGRNQAGKRVAGFNAGLGSVNTDHTVNITDNRVSDDTIVAELSNAITGNQVAAIVNAEASETVKTNLSGWQKFVNLVGGAFDAYNASSGSTAGLSVTVQNAGIVGSVLANSGSTGSPGISDMMFQGIRDALSIIQDAVANHYDDYAIPNPDHSYGQHLGGAIQFVDTSSPVRGNTAPYYEPRSPLDWNGGKTMNGVPLSGYTNGTYRR